MSVVGWLGDWLVGWLGGCVGGWLVVVYWVVAVKFAVCWLLLLELPIAVSFYN